METRIPISILFIGAVALFFGTNPPRLAAAEPSNNVPSIRVDFVSPAARQPAALDPSTIFFDDFQSPPDDAARPASSHYLEYNRVGESFVQHAGEGVGGVSGAMKATFKLGQVTAGDLKVLFGRNPLDKGIRKDSIFHEIYWRVYVKHESGWEGNPAKLARATCLATPNWAQGFIAHVWGGDGDALCIDPATGIWNNERVSQKYNDFDHLHWLGLRRTHTPIFTPSESGRWVCVESHIRLNTPGNSDGVFELWIDGKIEANRADLNWQGTWSDYGINAVFLENYWNQGAVKQESRWFSNLIISMQPVGPLTATVKPLITRTNGDIKSWQCQVSADTDGNDIVWESKRVSGERKSLPIDSSNGVFSGDRVADASLQRNTVYWCRVKDEAATGEKSEWSDWHACFKTAR